MNPTDAHIKDRLLNIKDLPTIPAVHGRILKLIEDVNYSIEEVSRLIERDQVLSTKVLKLVNSPFYGLHSEVAAVRRAVVLLGGNLIRGVILSTALFGGMGEKLPGLWDHSYCCSMVAGFLARRFGLASVEEIMTGALLHDIGKILIKQQLKEAAVEIENVARSGGVLMIEAERQVIHITHDKVGLWLAEKWNLPDIIKNIIAYHHTPGRCGTHLKAAATVHFSDIIAKGIGVSYSDDPLAPALDEKGWASLGVDEGDIVDIVVEIVDLIQTDKMLSKYLSGGRGGEQKSI